MILYFLHVLCHFWLFGLCIQFCVCVWLFSRGAVWAARPRVRQMRRLPWWVSTIATRPCRFALVRSSEITAAPRRASKPAARSEFILLSALWGFFFLYQYRYFLWSAPAHHKNIIKTPHCFGNVRCQIWPVAWTLILALTSSFALTSFSHDSLKTTTDSAANELKEYTIHSYIVALVTYMYSIAHYYVKCYMHTYFLH